MSTITECFIFYHVFTAYEINVEKEVMKGDIEVKTLS